MRAPVDRGRLEAFMERLGRDVGDPGRVYLTGGATALLYGWRVSTVDIDLKLEPESRTVYEALPRLKDQLDLNIELASPGDFIPELPGWRDRSLFIGKHGPLHFFHYDPYAQALSKIERDHVRDRGDVAALIDLGLVEPAKALELFARIEPELIRFPAIDPPSFRARVEAVFRGR